MEQFVIRAPQVILTRWGHAPTPLPSATQEKLSRCGAMYFFDHGAWETPLTELAIDFLGFLQLADLMAQWEAFLDEEPSDTSQAEEHLRNAMRELAPGLPETYPFALR